MIRYRLECGCGHAFETWFQNSTAYDGLAARGDLRCPACGGGGISKAIMAPNLATRTTLSATAPGADPEAAAAPPADGTDDNSHHELRAAIRRLHRQVAEKADYVGPRFADEARRIDAGEAPDRGIYGEATVGDARALIEDGIAVLPLPRLPDEQN